MNGIKIQLGKMLKKENWKFYFQLVGNMQLEQMPKWITSFRKTSEAAGLDADVEAPSFIVEPNQYFAVISGGINNSESELRAQLEKVIDVTNQDFCGRKSELALEPK
ncbi:MAG: hypothetical protein ACLQAH_00285 [Limisphaerales bacterium]